MDDLTRRLRDADPVLREPGLSGEERRDLRRRIVAEASAVQDAAAVWRMLPLTAAFSVIVALAVLSVRSREAVPVGGNPTSPPPASLSFGDGRTQMQFSTPGGTRIVWTIDPAFHLKEAH